MANFVLLKFFKSCKDLDYNNIKKSLIDNPCERYLNLDNIEIVSPVYTRKVNLLNDDFIKTSDCVTIPIFFIKTISNTYYIMPGEEIEKIIDDNKKKSISHKDKK